MVDAHGRSTDHPVTVGLIQPSRLYASAVDYEREVERWRSVGLGVTVLVAEFDVITSTDRRDRRVADVGPKGNGSSALDKVLSRSEVLVALDVPNDLLTVAGRLRWIHLVKTGTERLARLGLPSEKVMVTNSRGSASPEIAEFVIARILEHFKYLPLIADAQRSRSWVPHYGLGLRWRRVCLVGFGSINQRVASLCGALGMDVVVIRRAADGGLVDGHPAYAVEDLDTVLPECDVVVAALPETSSTIGLFGRSSFRVMKDGALFINVGRGSCVDEDALIEALRSGRLGAAALDVVQAEPLPVDDRLWSAPNLRLSAHCSSSPPIAVAAANELGRQNLLRYLRGDELVNLVESG